MRPSQHRREVPAFFALQLLHFKGAGMPITRADLVAALPDLTSTIRA